MVSVADVDPHGLANVGIGSASRVLRVGLFPNVVVNAESGHVIS